MPCHVVIAGADGLLCGADLFTPAKGTAVPISATLVIIAITAVISYFAFNDHKLLERLILLSSVAKNTGD